MKFSPIYNNKIKIAQKFKYNTNILQQNKNINIFGIKQNRDITPFRKYKLNQKTKLKKNLINKKQNNKEIKIEDELISSSNFQVKRARTPLNRTLKENTKNNNIINKYNLNSVSLNNSTKFKKPQIYPKTNRLLSFGNNNKLNNLNKIKNNILNKSYNLNKNNRAVTPNGKYKLNKSSNFNFNHPKSLKFNRSITPNPKSKAKIGLSKSNSKINFGKNLKLYKIDNKSPILKKKNILQQSNSIPNKSLFPKNNISNHYSNKFKSKNIFSSNYINKKPKVFTINENYSSSSFKNNINDINQNKDTSKTDQSNYSGNNTINNNNFNAVAQIESNNSIVISGIKTENNYNNNNILKENKNDINENKEPSNNIPKEIRKKILCMHEFSKTGFAGEDEKKLNQDNYFVFRNFVNNVDYIFMAVCDGHGAVGQEISNFLKENLPIDLNHALRDAKIDILKDDISSIITDIFIKENTKLISNEMINSMLSGSTCVSTIYTPLKLITANVGDSRIILGKNFPNSLEWKSVDLTRDHKPSLPDEEKRILEKGGRIEPMKDEDNTFIGPPRVWLKKQDYPGLAMSRSFGDRVAHSVGVSEEPEIKEYKFCKEDKFFVVASDGLFEFISSQDIVNIIKDYYIKGDIVGCCEYLYELSREKWMNEEEVVDDITMILVFLEDD